MDAVTRATTLNPSIGDPAALTDGRTPDLDADAPAFEWLGLGLLAVAWPQPMVVTTLRVYLGYMDRYTVLGFVGGNYTETGRRVDVETPVYSRDGIVTAAASGWYEIRLPSEQAIDNLGFQVTGGAILYEIDFLGADGTTISFASFGTVKRLFSERATRKGHSELSEPLLQPPPR